MNYSLHQEASQDLDNAAAYYQKQAGNILSQAFLNEFELAVKRLLRHPLRLVPGTPLGGAQHGPARLRASGRDGSPPSSIVQYEMYRSSRPSRL